MLFCTAAFGLFFAVVFVAYWALPDRRARAGFLIAAGLSFAYTTGRCLGAVDTGAWLAFARALTGLVSADALRAWASSGVLPLPPPPPLLPSDPTYWLAGIVVAAAALAYRVGADRARVWLLVLASFYFYACFNRWLATLIFVSTAADYVIARGLDALTAPRLRRLLLTLSLVGNLGLLALFKYANFFLHSLEEVLHAAGATASLPVLRVLLPVGISFYTFEAINYTVDVYRRRVPAERNLANFLLFITFFPHLVAGPIVRARDFLPQVRRRKHWDWARLELGARFFLLGLLKKWALADRMAEFVDPVFAQPDHYNSHAVWLAVLAYALQIYGDFSGYSDMALGTAHMLGYKLAQNFNMPYLSANFSEFWRRWHMSLSSWLRDYLFIPLGGSRCPRWRTCLNLLLTMTLGGLWHGASWTFVLWGVLHGGLLVTHRYFRDFCAGRPRLDRLLQTAPGTALRVAVTFLGVATCWVFFRASTFAAAAEVLHRMVVPFAGRGLELHGRGIWYSVAVVALAYAVSASGLWRKWAVRLPAPALGIGYALALTLALVLCPQGGKAFIYFQF